MSSSNLIKETRKSERNDTIDLFRIIAACGVIWFHLGITPNKRVGYAGLVFFLLVSVFFQKGSAEGTNSHEFFRKRVVRHLPPWMAWFVIYGLLNTIVGKRFFPHTSDLLGNVLCGPWIGLWYLPFSFVSACIVFGLARLLRQLRPLTQFRIYSTVSILSLFLVATIRASASLSAPWAQWLQAAPSLPIGLAMACAFSATPRATLALIVYETTVLTTCVMIYQRDPGLAISYGIGSSLVVVGLLYGRRLSSHIGPLSALCFGVYLIHGVAMSGFKMIPWVSQHYLPWFILTTITSFLAVAMIRRVPSLQRFV